jgi:hypothetical protein
MLKTYFLILILILSQNLFAKNDPFLLAPGMNRDLVIQNCLACHSERIIIQNHMTRIDWDHKITWMQETQNLWPLTPEVRSKILDYLVSTQGILTPLQDKDSMDGLGPRRSNPLLFEEKRGG